MPSEADDRPAWGKVAVLAVVGFAVGIAWPRIAGVRLGPSAPAESIPAASRPSGAAAEGSAGATPASVNAAAPDGGSAAAAFASGGGGAGASPAPLVTVQRGAVLSCHTASGDLEKGASGCGDLSGLDALVTPRLRKLATCPAAAGQSGKLSVVLGVDFASNRLTAGIGKSSTVPDHDALATCLHAQLDALTLASIHHDQPKYTVQYTTTLASGGGGTASAASSPTTPPSPAALPGAAPAGEPAAATGDEPSVAIVWDVAIVRDTPRTGSVVARLSRGTKIRVAAGQDGWYRVKFGSGFSSEGWLYRGAIGK